MIILLILIILAVSVVIWLFLPQTQDPLTENSLKKSIDQPQNQYQQNILKEELEYTKANYFQLQKDHDQAKQEIKLLTEQIQKQAQWQNQEPSKLDLDGLKLDQQLKEKDEKILSLEKANRDICEELKQLKNEQAKTRKRAKTVKTESTEIVARPDQPLVVIAPVDPDSKV